MARTTLISVKSLDSSTYETAKQAIVGNSHVNTVQVNVDDATQTDVVLEYPLKSENVTMIVEEELANVKKAINKTNSTNDKRTVTVTVKEIVGRREAGFTPYTLELNIEDIVYAIEDGTEGSSTISAVTFTGSGLDDGTSGGTYTGDSVKEFEVEVDAKDGILTTALGAGGTGYAVGDTFTVNTGSVLATGTVVTEAGGVVATYTIDTAGDGYSVAAGVATTATSGSGNDDLTIDISTLADSFKWSNDGGVTYEAELIQMTAGAQALEEGATITFAAVVGHTTGDKWAFTATPSTGADTIVRHYDESKSELVDYVVDEKVDALKTACNG